MGDRFFPNEFPDFVAETEEITQTATATDALSKLLSLPYHKTAESFLRRAIDLKDKVLSLSLPLPLSFSSPPQCFAQLSSFPQKSISMVISFSVEKELLKLRD